MKDPLISIIVPVYNVSNYLERCVKSLLSQTYTKIEIILIDDGSTDESGVMCDQLAKTDNRIKVVHQKNQGLSAARNAGIDRALGQFMSFIDSDDYINKHFVKSMYTAIYKNDADIAVCGYQTELDDQQQTIIECTLPDSKKLSGRKALIKLLTQQENIDVIAWNKLYKAYLFNKTGINFPVGKNHEDNLTTYKLFAEANSVVYIDRPLYNYIKRDNSIMGQRSLLSNAKMKELAAIEANNWLKNNGLYPNDNDILDATQISLLLAKLYFLNSMVITKNINQKLWKNKVSWINNNRKNLRSNPYFIAKLRLYAFLLRFGEQPYKAVKSILLTRGDSS